MAKRKKPAPDRKQDRDGLTVFISSTSEDLKPHRAAARDAVLGAELRPIQMETFAASGEHPPLKACLQKVSAADVIVLIVAHRYGWVPEDQEGKQTIEQPFLLSRYPVTNRQLELFMEDGGYMQREHWSKVWRAGRWRRL